MACAVYLQAVYRMSHREATRANRKGCQRGTEVNTCTACSTQSLRIKRLYFEPIGGSKHFFSIQDLPYKSRSSIVLCVTRTALSKYYGTKCYLLVPYSTFAFYIQNTDDHLQVNTVQRHLNRRAYLVEVTFKSARCTCIRNISSKLDFIIFFLFFKPLRHQIGRQYVGK